MRSFLFVLACMVMGMTAHAQISLTTAGTANVQNFNAFDGSGFSPTPTASQLDADHFIGRGFSNGSMNFGDTETSGDFARGSASAGVSSGGIYAFDTGAGNIAWGAQPTGSDFTPGEFVIRYQNNTGSTLASLDISYIIQVYNDQNRANSFNFSYATSANATYGAQTFTAVPTLDFASPQASDAAPAWMATNRTTTISSLTIANGEYIFLRFESNDVSGSGSRDQIGVDDVSITGNASSGAQTTTVQFLPTSSTVNENVGTVSLPVELKTSDGNASSAVVNATVSLTSGTAIDFTGSTTANLTFAAGTASGTKMNAQFNVDDDALPEADEMFGFTLTSTNADNVTNDMYTLTVQDNEPKVNFSAATSFATEGDGTTSLTVDISSPPATNVTVEVALTAGPGSGADVDNYITQNVLFPAGSGASQQIILNITDDMISEGPEDLTFSLQNLSANALLDTPNTHVLTLFDNELGNVPTAWINEISYDNTSSDTDDFIEIVAPVGADMSNLGILLVNGNGNVGYNYVQLNGIISNTNAQNGFGLFVLTTNQSGSITVPAGVTTQASGFSSIQNGAPDGALLVDAITGNVVDGIWYEGGPPPNTITNGGGGPAPIYNTSDIDESAAGDGGTAGDSIYQTGDGDSDNWVAGMGTPGAANPGQTRLATEAIFLAFDPTTATVNEGDGTVNLPILLTTSDGQPSSKAVTATVSLSTGSADDLTGATSATTTFAQGTNTDTKQNVAFNIHDDNLAEGVESLTFTLLAPDADNVAQDTFTLTIEDNEPFVQFDPTSLAVTEDAGTATLTVVISTAPQADVTVDVAITGGTGSAADVGSFTSQLVTFPAGSNAAQTVNVPITDDTEAEGLEAVLFGLQNLSANAALGPNASFNLSIFDNESVTLPTIWINEVSYDNTNADTDEFVEIIGPVGTDLSQFGLLFARDTDASAYAYVPLVGTIGQTNALSGFGFFVLTTTKSSAVAVPAGVAMQASTLGDIRAGSSGIFLVSTINGQVADAVWYGPNPPPASIDNANIGGPALNYSTAGIEILPHLDQGNAGQAIFQAGIGDSDLWSFGTMTPGAVNTNQGTLSGHTVTVLFDPTESTVNENASTASLPVKLITSNQQATTEPIMVTVALTQGSADDFTGATTMDVTFPTGTPHDTSLNATFNINDDDSPEGNESKVFTLSSNEADRVFSPQHTLTIEDDEAVVFFIATEASVNEGDGTISLQVGINQAPSEDVTVDVALSSGLGISADVGDFTSETVTFSAGNGAAQTVTLPITDDTEIEGPETIVCVLANPSANASFGSTTTWTLTIYDNESITIPEAWINEVSYNNARGDQDEFIELMAPVGTDMSNLGLLFVDGGTNTAYAYVRLVGTVSATNAMQGTGFFIITTEHSDRIQIPSGITSQNSGLANIQDGPDGIVLISAIDGTVVDGIWYGSDTPPASVGNGTTGGPAPTYTTSGLQALTVTDQHAAGLGLYQTGTGDSNQWAFGPLSPGVLNQGQDLPDTTPVELDELPNGFSLSANYPNPFNPATQFTVALAETQEVTIAVYDLLGREVALLHDGLLQRDQHIFRFEAGTLPSGTYLYRITGASFTQVRRMILLK